MSTRDRWLRVRLTPTEDKELEAMRGQLSRSNYIRMLLRKAQRGSPTATASRFEEDR